MEENGYAERAEFIRIQTEINRLETQVWCNLEWTDAEWGNRERWEKKITDECNNSECPKCGPLDVLRRRESQLLWRQDMPDGEEAFPRRDWFPFDEKLSYAHGGWNYHRGFVESIRCHYRNWRDNWKELLESAPIRKVTLTSQPELGTEWPVFSHNDPMSFEVEGQIIQIPHRPYPEYAPGSTRNWYKTVLELRWPGIEFETTWNSLATTVNLPNELLQFASGASEAPLRDITYELVRNLFLYGTLGVPPPLGLIRMGSLPKMSFVQLPAANLEPAHSITSVGKMTASVRKRKNRKARRSGN